VNYKLLFPTYRNRYRFIQRQLKRWQPAGRWEQGLNLGAGEGDYDAMIAGHCRQLTACDINDADVAFAQRLNADVANLSYQVENALDLQFPNQHFDLLVSVDVLEHVGQPRRMMEEVGRVLRPGGLAFITFPNLNFPATYDPVNRWLAPVGQPRLRQGAYAFGHDYLVDPAEFRRWAENNQLEVIEEHPLSGYLVGLLEMYWTGIVQRWFKANATNLDKGNDDNSRVVLRPSRREPWLCLVTDAVLWLDARLNGKGKYSVGRGFVLRRI
jgi:2-polyprenyl-3-methyl-5-hydroxy-6-metoxy-1,4-benzoquinol methylase